MTTAGTTWTARISWLLMAAAVLVLIVMTAETAAAEKKVFVQKANGVSIKDRTQAQSDLCWVGGGTSEVTPTVNGKPNDHTHTTCHGGQYDGMECINTKNNTWCSMPRTQPVDPGLGDGRIAEGTVDAVQVASQPAITPQDVTVGRDRVVARDANPDDEQP